MVALIDLPNEILSLIIRSVAVEDVESVAQLSKLFYSLSFHQLQEHRSLIRKYSFFSSYLSNEERTGTKDTLRLLETVLREPYIGHYIREVEFDQIVDDNDIDIQEYKDEHFELISNAVHQHDAFKSIRCTPSDRYASMRAEIVSGGKDLLLAILLTRMPNLSTFQLGVFSASSSQRSWIREVLKHAICSTSVLSKLKNVTLLAMYWSYTLHEMSLLSAIPSVRTLRALKPNLRDVGEHTLDILRTYTSKVTRLILIGSHLDTNSIHRLLRLLKYLEEFKFSCGLSRTSPIPFDPHLIKSALLYHTTTTLRKLSLLMPRNRQIYLGTFTEFLVLQDLQIDWDALLPGDCDARSLIPKLLPSSLRSLCLYGSKAFVSFHYIATSNNALSVIEGILQSRFTNTHSLEEIRFMKQLGPPPFFKHRCRHALLLCEKTGLRIRARDIDDIQDDRSSTLCYGTGDNGEYQETMVRELLTEWYLSG
ncbi:MAG: hypothetical protein Q9164_002494 [Protoblastenia rupestris]